MRAVFGTARREAQKSVDAHFADLHVMSGDDRIDAVWEGSVARFFVPPHAQSLALVSRIARPCDVSTSGDRRELGVCLSGLVIIDGLRPDERIQVDDPRLGLGVHQVEEGLRRWTSGWTPLPSEITARRPNGFFLRVELAGSSIC